MFNKKGWIASLLSVFLLIGMMGSAFAEELKPVTLKAYYAPLQYVFDDQQLTPPEGQQGFIHNGRTYVPLRFVAYALNKAVDWDGDTLTITMDEPNNSQKVEMHDYLINRVVRDKVESKAATYDWKPSNIKAYTANVSFVVDGKKVETSKDVQAFIINSRTYVPLRFVGEMLGKHIGWDPDTFMITASNEAPDQDSDQPQSGDDKPTTPGTVPGTPGGGLPGGGGGGGAKPTKESIENKYISQAEQLEARCQEQLSGVVAKYFEAKTDEEKQKLISQGESYLASCDSSFSSITSNLTSELTANGYTTEKVNEMISYYEKTKRLAEALLRSK